MTDVANLKYDIDSRGAAGAADNLDRMNAAAKRAEDQAVKTGTATSAAADKAMAGILRMVTSIERTVKEIAALTRSHADFVRGMAEGAVAAVREANALDQVAASTRHAATENASYAVSIRSVTANVDGASLALGRYATQVTHAGDETQKAGNGAKVAVHHFDTLYDELQRDFVGIYNAGMKRAEAQNDRLAKGSRLASHELVNLGRQFSDVGVSLASGQAPWMVAIQQGAQIGEVFAVARQRGVTFGSAVKGIGEAFGPLIARAVPLLGIFGALAAGFGLAGKAFLDGEKDANQLSNALKVTGNYAGVTAVQFETMAAQVSDSTHTGFGKARAAMQDLVSTGKFTGQTIQTLGELSVRLGEQTGQSGAKVASSFAGMGDDVTAFAIRFNEQYHLITAVQVEHIRLLQEQGKIAEATAYMSAQALAAQRARGEADLGILEKAWRGVSNAISDAWQALKSFGNEGAARAGEIRSLQADIASKQALLTGRNTPADRATQVDIQVLQSRLKAMQATETEARRVAQAQQAGAQAEQAAIRAQDEHARVYRTMGDNAAAAREEINRYRQAQEAIRKVNPNSRELDSAARAAQIEAAIQKKYTPAATQAANAAEKLAERLAREIQATNATAAANIELAQAYGESGIEALKAEARAEAVGKAIRRQGDIDAFVAAEMNANIAKQAVASAKAAAELQAHADAQTRANDAVTYGGKTFATAQRAMETELQLRPLVIAQQYAQEEVTKAGTRATQAQKNALNAATAALQAHRKASADDAAEQLRARNIQFVAQAKDEVALLREQAKYLAASNAERARAIAMKREELAQTAAGYDPATATDKQRAAHDAAVTSAGEAASAAEDLRTAQDAYNDSLNHTLTLLQEMAGHTEALGAVIASSFGQAGHAIDLLASGFATYKANQEQLRREEEEARKKLVLSEHATAEERAAVARREAEIGVEYAQKRQNAEVEANLAAIEGVKGLLSKKSAAYKVLTALELAYQAVQIAGVVIDAINTAKSIALATARAAAKGVEAIATAMASVPFPFNIAAAAATSAALIGFGVKLLGHGGGSTSAPSAEDIQKRQGTGTVLGDAAAKSESLTRAMEAVADNTNRDLEYSNGMLRHLRSIDSQIGALTGLLSRQLVSGGFLDASSIQGLGTRLSGGSVGGLLGGPIFDVLSKIPVIGGIIKGLFGTKKTTTLRDLGIDFDPQDLDAILSGGLAGDAYQSIDVKTKKKFFGITTSNKTKTTTTETPLEQDILTEMTRIIENLRGGVLQAAGVLGVEGAQAALAAFQVNLGTISFKDKTGEEIQAELEAVFGKLADEMAIAALPFLSQLQKVGEGAFETLARVARDYQVVDVTLQSIGRTFGSVGTASLVARERLIGLFDSLDDFVDKTTFFAENFLTEAERIAPIQAAVVKEFQRLGVTGVNNIEQFKQLVLGLDLTTTAGQDMYAALLAVAPAFKKVFDFISKGSEEVNGARDDLRRAYEKEASALEDLRDRHLDYAKSLGAYLDELTRGPAARLSPERQFLASQAHFRDVAARARLGDESALAEIQNAGEAYRTASEAYYASSGKHFENLDEIRTAVEAARATALRTASNADQQLTALKAQVSGLITLNESVLSVRDAITALQAAMAAAAAAAATNATPFSPATSATGATAPSYTYGTPAAGGFDAAGYLQHNPDVAQEFTNEMATAEGQAYLNAVGVKTAEDFARLHYDTFGKTEGRNPFATGGSFTVAGSGPKDFGPVTLHGGETANISRADTMAAMVTELKGLREDNKTLKGEVVSLRATLARHGQVTVEAQDRTGQRIERAVTRSSTERLKGGGRAA